MRWKYAAPIIAIGLSACEPAQVTNNDDALYDSMANNAVDAVGQFQGFHYKKFAEVKGWTVWYFQTDLGYKCVGTKGAIGERAPLPQAVFLRQSVSDVRLDIWLTDGIPIVRVPNLDDDFNYETAGYYRIRGQQFLKQMDFDNLAQLQAGLIEIRPEGEVGSDKDTHIIDVSGISDAANLVSRCDKSGPKA